MFADPITVTVNAVAKVLTKINQDGYSSEYLLQAEGSEYRLRIRNSSYNDKSRGNKRVNRHNVEIVYTIYPVAPSTISTIRKSYVVFENDNGDTLTDPVKVAAGLLTFLTEANLTKLINFES